MISTVWKTRHLQAWASPDGIERPIRDLISAWERYAIAYQAHYTGSIGDDGVLGVAWAEIGHGLIHLLNGELGRLDASTLDKMIQEVGQAHGADEASKW